MSNAVRVIGILAGILLVAPAPARAVDETDIEQAVARGVQYLKAVTLAGIGPPAGSGQMHQQMGGLSLAGIALIECGVPRDDPVVLAIARSVRRNAPTTSHTYSISLDLLFLDRLGDAGDEALIQALGNRLLMGQNDGGWSYYCPVIIGEDELKKLRERAGKEEDAPKTAPGASQAPKPLMPRVSGGPAPLGGGQNDVPGTGGAPAFVPPAIGGGGLPPGPQFVPGGGFPDNSNTQFATLGLWTARRHGVKADRALRAIEQRFRLSQSLDGGWGYTLAQRNAGSTAAMTCAGLLGLAVGIGVSNDAAVLRSKLAKDNKSGPPGKEKGIKHDYSKDENVRAGLIFLGSCIDHPRGLRRGQRGQFDANIGKGYYFLWSLERVAVAYSLNTLSKKDWYGWGAEILLVTQSNDGSWQGEYSGYNHADTSFALLFLRKANLAEDLASSLRGKFNDPGERQLRGGGVGDPNKRAPAIALQQKGKQVAQAKPDFGREKLEPPSGSARPLSNDNESDRLADELVKAAGSLQEAVLTRLRDGKGVVYTQALAAAIPHLTGAIKTKAREALAERLATMTAVTLKDKLQDEDLEVRRAAALACAVKEDPSFIPSLIALLTDPEPPVAKAAHAALKALAKKDFGPASDASNAERQQAIDKWKEWWKQHEE